MILLMDKILHHQGPRKMIIRFRVLTIPRWLFGISEPSTVETLCISRKKGLLHLHLLSFQETKSWANVRISPLRLSRPPAGSLKPKAATWGKIHLFMKMSVGIWDMGFYMGICTKKWKDAWKLLSNHFLYPKTMSIEEYSLSEGGSIWATKRSLTWQSIESWLCNDGILEMVLLWGISLDTYILRAAPKTKKSRGK